MILKQAPLSVEIKALGVEELNQNWRDAKATNCQKKKSKAPVIGGGVQRRESTVACTEMKSL